MLLRRHLKHRGYESVEKDIPTPSNATEVTEGTGKDIINYEELTVDELKELAKGKEITGYSNMKKAELIEALTDD